MIVYAILFICYISISLSIYLNTKRLKVEKNEKSQFDINSLNNNYFNSDNGTNYIKEKDMYIFESYNEIVKFIGKEAQIVKLEIIKENIILNLSVTSNNDYVNFINKVEQSNTYLIKHLSPPEDKDNLVHFIIVLQFSWGRYEE
jgi:hypothetical protein